MLVDLRFGALLVLASLVGCGGGGGVATQSCPDLAGSFQSVTGTCNSPSSCVVNASTCTASCNDGSQLRLSPSGNHFTFTTPEGAQCNGQVVGSAVNGTCSEAGTSCTFQGSFVREQTGGGSGGTSGSGGSAGGGSGGFASGGTGTGGTIAAGDCNAICADLEAAGDPECISGCEETCAAPVEACDVCVCSGAGILNCLDACSATDGSGGAGTGGTAGGGYDCDAICTDAGLPGDADCLSGCAETCPAPPTDCDACICSGVGIEVCNAVCVD